MYLMIDAPLVQPGGARRLRVVHVSCDVEFAENASTWLSPLSPSSLMPSPPRSLSLLRFPFPFPPFPEQSTPVFPVSLTSLSIKPPLTESQVLETMMIASLQRCVNLEHVTLQATVTVSQVRQLLKAWPKIVTLELGYCSTDVDSGGGGDGAYGHDKGDVGGAASLASVTMRCAPCVSSLSWLVTLPQLTSLRIFSLLSKRQIRTICECARLVTLRLPVEDGTFQRLLVERECDDAVLPELQHLELRYFADDEDPLDYVCDLSVFNSLTKLDVDVISRHDMRSPHGVIFTSSHVQSLVPLSSSLTSLCLRGISCNRDALACIPAVFPRLTLLGLSRMCESYTVLVDIIPKLHHLKVVNVPKMLFSKGPDVSNSAADLIQSRFPELTIGGLDP